MADQEGDRDEEPSPRTQTVESFRSGVADIARAVKHGLDAIWERFQQRHGVTRFVVQAVAGIVLAWAINRTLSILQAVAGGAYNTLITTLATSLTVAQLLLYGIALILGFQISHTRLLFRVEAQLGDIAETMSESDADSEPTPTTDGGRDQPRDYKGRFRGKPTGGGAVGGAIIGATFGSNYGTSGLVFGLVMGAFLGHEVERWLLNRGAL